MINFLEGVACAWAMGIACLYAISRFFAFGVEIASGQPVPMLQGEELWRSLVWGGVPFAVLFWGRYFMPRPGKQ